MKRTVISYVIIVFTCVFLTACKDMQDNKLASIATEFPDIYTSLGKPEGLNGEIRRMEREDQTCYVMWGGTGASVSCPLDPHTPAENPANVVYTVWKVEGLNGKMATMQDGEQICYLIWGGTDVDIDCP